MQRDRDRSEITGVTWKNTPERILDGSLSGKVVDSIASQLKSLITRRNRSHEQFDAIVDYPRCIRTHLLLVARPTSIRSARRARCASPRAKWVFDVPAQIPRRSGPFRLRIRRARLHARRDSRPGPVQKTIRPLRYTSPSTARLGRSR